jgi:hypothetical protein
MKLSFSLVIHQVLPVTMVPRIAWFADTLPSPGVAAEIQDSKYVARTETNNQLKFSCCGLEHLDNWRCSTESLFFDAYRPEPNIFVPGQARYFAA